MLGLQASNGASLLVPYPAHCKRPLFYKINFALFVDLLWNPLELYRIYETQTFNEINGCKDEIPTGTFIQYVLRSLTIFFTEPITMSFIFSILSWRYHVNRPTTVLRSFFLKFNSFSVLSLGLEQHCIKWVWSCVRCQKNGLFSFPQVFVDFLVTQLVIPRAVLLIWVPVFLQFIIYHIPLHTLRPSGDQFRADEFPFAWIPVWLSQKDQNSLSCKPSI